MKRLPSFSEPVFKIFFNTMTQPTEKRILLFLLAAILCRGRRTFSAICRSSGYLQGSYSSYQRLFSKRVWSTWKVSYNLISYILKNFLPSGEVILAVDDTVTERPGKKVYAKGCHRDAVRSSHQYTAYKWGLKWVVISISLKFSFSSRVWALPVMVALYKPKEWSEMQGKHHKTPAHISRLLLAKIIRWFPTRRFIITADCGFGTRESARFCDRYNKKLAMISKFRGDATLVHPVPYQVGNMGRPRKKTNNLPKPSQVVNSTLHPEKLEVAWYGGGKRRVAVVTQAAHWYQIGKPMIPVRWVWVQDLTGTHRDEYFYSTDITHTAQEIIEIYTQRWSIETTFQECREYLNLESTKCYAEKTVLRFIPGIFILYTLICLLYARLPSSSKKWVLISWPGKSGKSFGDLLFSVRREIWLQWVFHKPQQRQVFCKLPKDLYTSLLYGLAA